MKNFKKVISAVIALAMVISSFTAVSASKFVDVADTAAYAEAVEVLATLNIVNGVEEDGVFSFKPENLVTRAEAATMIVGALNMSGDAQASAGTSQFGDVNTQASWASGFVNVGVAQGFINGYDASTFGPLDNVTYAQLCVMLTAITGYGEYAAANGGWPTGYTNMAAATGINKGVAVATDAALTRGQVAMMIYNALTVGKLGVYEYSLTGNTYTQLDGKNGRDYQTLLSEKFDGYTATVTINGTPVATGLDNGEVEFTVVKSDWWPEEEAAISSSNARASKSLYAANVDVNGNYLQTGKAVFVTNEDEELVMVYFAATGKTETKELAANTYVPQSKLTDKNQFSTDNQKIRFGSTYYKLADSTAVYVNGTFYTNVAVEADAAEVLTTAQATLDKLIGGAYGTVKLVKADSEVNAYSAIFVDYYQVAKVSSVDVDNDETVISLIGIKGAINDDAADWDEIVITDEAVAEGDTIVNVTRNGAEADLSSIVKGDIIAYAVDFTGDGLVDPTLINIIATTDVVNGTVTKIVENQAGKSDNEYTIGGTVYKHIAGDETISIALKNSLNVTLDPFGRIYDVEVDGTNKKFAIALRVTSSDELVLLHADGTSKTYEVTSSVKKQLDDIAKVTKGEGDVTDRIVTYTVKGSTGELSSVAFVEADEKKEINDVYKERSGSAKLGVHTISSTTAIIDASAAAEDKVYDSASVYAAYSKDQLVNGTEYTGVALKDGTYVSFVVLTSIGTKFSESSRFAVVVEEAADHIAENGDEVELVKVLYNGTLVEDLLFVPGVADNLKAGDVFFFETDSDGFVKEDYEVYDKEKGELSTLDGDLLPPDAPWSYDIWDEKADVILAKGIVTEVTSTSIAFASYDNINKKGAYLDTNKDLAKETKHDDGIVVYGIDSECVVYTYDEDKNEFDEAKKFKAETSAIAIKASNFDKFDKGNDNELNDGIYANYEVEVGKDEDDKPIMETVEMIKVATEAIVMIVDGDVVAIFAIEN